MLIQHIALVGDADAVSGATLARVSAALQEQVTDELSPTWGIAATVAPFARLEDVPVGYWPIIVTADPLCHHARMQIDRESQPYAWVNASLCWSLDASRICLQTLRTERLCGLLVERRLSASRPSISGLFGTPPPLAAALADVSLREDGGSVETVDDRELSELPAITHATIADVPPLASVPPIVGVPQGESPTRAANSASPSPTIATRSMPLWSAAIAFGATIALVLSAPLQSAQRAGAPPVVQQALTCDEAATTRMATASASEVAQDAATMSAVPAAMKHSAAASLTPRTASAPKHATAARRRATVVKAEGGEKNAGTAASPAPLLVENAVAPQARLARADLLDTRE